VCVRDCCALCVRGCCALCVRVVEVVTQMCLFDIQVYSVP